MAVTVGGQAPTTQQKQEFATVFELATAAALSQTNANVAQKYGPSSSTPVADLVGALQGTDKIILVRGSTVYTVPLTTLQAFLGGTPVATEPGTFQISDWSLTAIAGGVILSITNLPNDGGSALTALQYSTDGTTWTNLSGLSTGDRTITSLSAVEYNFQIRAVNAVGSGAASDTKAVTPLASSNGLWTSFAVTNYEEPLTALGESFTLVEPAGASSTGIKVAIFDFMG